MFQSLYSRLALVLLGVFLSMGVLLFMFFEYLSVTTQNQVSQLLHKDFAINVQMNLDVIKDDAIDSDKIKEVFRSMMVIGPALELYIIDDTGNVIAYQAAEEKIKRRIVAVEPIKSFIKGDDSYPIYGDDPRSKNKKKIFSAARVYAKNNQIVNQTDGDDGVTIGYLYAIIGGEDYDNIFASLASGNTWKLRLIGMFSGLLFLLLASLLLFYALTRPLRKLSKEIKAFEDSGFKNKPGINSLQVDQEGEVNQLKNSFYQMEQRIFDLVERLNKQEELRREFLTYLSHDLRTPLMGMKANLETLEINKNSMPITERQHFLEKARINGDRLESMINELFELTRLDGNQVEVNIDEFSIDDLLSDISSSLDSLASSKVVKLSIQRRCCDVRVMGDIEKIERVIQNLVENAVRYSDKGSTVILNTTEFIQNNLSVKIIDFGTGISEEDLLHIFQPYSQVADQQDFSNKGIGLGLAICQRLLALQDIELMVESVLGEGTMFSFNVKTIH